jgi:hypothetical protein
MENKTELSLLMSVVIWQHLEIYDLFYRPYRKQYLLLNGSVVLIS